jgi:hypothetical protein
VTAQNAGRPRRTVRPGALRITALPTAPGVPERHRTLYPGPAPVRVARVREFAAAGPPRALRVPVALSSEKLSLIALGLLAAYGEMRSATMTWGVGAARWIAMFAVALTAAVAVRRLPRLAGVAVALAGLLALLPLAGFPLAWLYDVRIAVTVRAIRHGLSTLPAVIVPYVGGDGATRATIALGAGVLLLVAGLCAGWSRGAAGRAAAACALLALAVVPSALARPQYGGLHGLTVLLLLILGVPGIHRRRGALTLTLAAAGAAVLAAVVLASLKPALSFVRIADGLGQGAGQGLSFDWAQTYGPINWPQTGQEVLRVTAPRPAYWKAEDLDSFDGRAWNSLGLPGAGDLAGVPRQRIARYTERLTVRIGAMSSTNVIAAGLAARPALAGVAGGDDAGTWVATLPLGPGAGYAVRVYDPQPSAAAMAAAGTDYPAAIRAFTTVPTEPADAPAVALAARLDPPGTTPYRFATNVIAYLHRHERYTVDPPPPGGLPLISFLFATHAGYCQQYAGAMALLLRLRGVPARVAVGFTSGAVRRGVYHVTDLDAHAWVEVYFPGWGWVDFDPTPAGPGAAATGGAFSSPGRKLAPVAASPSHARRLAGVALPGHSRHRRLAGGSLLPWLEAVLALACVGLVGVGVGLRRQRPLTLATLVSEVEAAHRAAGRPLAPGTTLLSAAGALDGAAAAYLRGLAGARYAGAAPAREAVRRGRRALRQALVPRRAHLACRARVALVLAPWRRLD